jgi:hypothetical protein
MYSLAPIGVGIKISRVESTIVIDEVPIDIIPLDDYR